MRQHSPRCASSLDDPVEASALATQLIELSSLRRELERLYESTAAELHEARATAASEQEVGRAAAAENAALRTWNAQLSEELTVLVNELHAEEDDAAEEDNVAFAPRSAADRTFPLETQLRVGARTAAAEDMQPFGASCVATEVSSGGAGLDFKPNSSYHRAAASGVISGSDGHEQACGRTHSPSAQLSSLTSANAELVRRLLHLRECGGAHERRVAQRLVSRLLAAGSTVPQHGIDKVCVHAPVEEERGSATKSVLSLAPVGEAVSERSASPAAEVQSGMHGDRQSGVISEAPLASDPAPSSAECSAACSGAYSVRGLGVAAFVGSDTRPWHAASTMGGSNTVPSSCGESLQGRGGIGGAGEMPAAPMQGLKVGSEPSGTDASCAAAATAAAMAAAQAAVAPEVAAPAVASAPEPAHKERAQSSDRTAADVSAGMHANVAGVEQLIAQQRAQVELAALSVRHVSVQARLHLSRREAKELRERNAELTVSANELLRDLTSATRRIGKLERRIGEQVDLARQLDAVKAKCEELASAVRRVEEERDVACMRVRASEMRASSARRVVRRSAMHSAEIAAAARVLAAENARLHAENVKMRALCRELDVHPGVPPQQQSSHTISAPFPARGVYDALAALEKGARHGVGDNWDEGGECEGVEAYTVAGGEQACRETASTAIRARSKAGVGCFDPRSALNCMVRDACSDGAGGGGDNCGSGGAGGSARACYDVSGAVGDDMYYDDDHDCAECGQGGGAGSDSCLADGPCQELGLDQSLEGKCTDQVAPHTPVRSMRIECVTGSRERVRTAERSGTARAVTSVCLAEAEARADAELASAAAAEVAAILRESRAADFAEMWDHDDGGRRSSNLNGFGMDGTSQRLYGKESLQRQSTGASRNLPMPAPTIRGPKVISAAAPASAQQGRSTDGTCKSTKGSKQCLAAASAVSTTQQSTCRTRGKLVDDPATRASGEDSSSHALRSGNGALAIAKGQGRTGQGTPSVRTSRSSPLLTSAKVAGGSDPRQACAQRNGVARSQCEPCDKFETNESGNNSENTKLARRGLDDEDVGNLLNAHAAQRGSRPHQDVRTLSTSQAQGTERAPAQRMQQRPPRGAPQCSKRQDTRESRPHGDRFHDEPLPGLSALRARLQRVRNSFADARQQAAHARAPSSGCGIATCW